MFGFFFSVLPQGRQSCKFWEMVSENIVQIFWNQGRPLKNSPFKLEIVSEFLKGKSQEANAACSLLLPAVHILTHFPPPAPTFKEAHTSGSPRVRRSLVWPGILTSDTEDI